MIRTFLIISTIVGSADCLMCYQCADSSGNDGKNDCQKYTRTMMKYRKLFDKRRAMGKYVKNCTGFGNLPEDKIYCVIASVESGGEVRSFIRDCSDGENFFAADYNEQFLQGNVLSDNRTSCIYTYSPEGIQGYLACVTLCRDEDFCNGPSSAGTINSAATIMPLLLALFVAVL